MPEDTLPNFTDKVVTFYVANAPRGIEAGIAMRRTVSLLLALTVVSLVNSSCHHDDAVVNPPAVAVPVVTKIQPNPTEVF